MNYHEAISILNAVRRGTGGHFSVHQITIALRLTGDLDE